MQVASCSSEWPSPDNRQGKVDLRHTTARNWILPTSERVSPASPQKSSLWPILCETMSREPSQADPGL